MKKTLNKFIIGFIIFFLSFGFIYILFFTYLAHPHNYINQNIPPGFLYTDFRIRMSKHGPLDKKIYKYKLNGVTDNPTCSKEKTREIIYFALTGSYRVAIVCKDEYYIYNYTGSEGPSLYGPFDTPTSTQK